MQEKEFGIHDYFVSRWKRRPAEVLKEFKIHYETYIFGNDHKSFYPDGTSKDVYEQKGYLYVYKTDPLTNLLIYAEIGVTDDCPIAEIEVPC